MSVGDLYGVTKIRRPNKNYFLIFSMDRKHVQYVSNFGREILVMVLIKITKNILTTFSP